MKITAKYLTKVFAGGVYALNDFSVQIESGDFVTVLGESGSGKTTFLRLLSGLEKPTAGELYFDDILFSALPLKKRDTSVVFQEYVLYPNMTVWENVAAALKRYGLTREEEDSRVRKALKDFDLLKLRSQLPRVLSGGQQQRVALARAVVREPALLLFDEPLSNVAEEQREEYARTISELKDRLPKTTFVYVTHNVREAVALGDKILIMEEGRVLQFGEKRRIWSNPYTLDVLRTLAGELKETGGQIKDGVVLTEDGEEIPVPQEVCETLSASEGTYVTAVGNPYNNYALHLFDKEGNSVCRELSEYRFQGKFDGSILSFADTSYEADENFRLRFIGQKGNVTVGIRSELFRTHRRPDDVSIAAVDLGKGVYDIDGRKICLYGAENFSGAFYVAAEDLNLYDGNGIRCLAHYRVYPNVCEGRVVGGKLKLPCGTLSVNASDGAYTAEFTEEAEITVVKNAGNSLNVSACLAEDDLGGKKLVYCVLKGFDRYVTFRADSYKKFLGAGKFRVAVSDGGIVLRR